MSNKSILGIDLTEWNSLSGLSDPYSLELAKISAAAGVPRVHVLSESSDDSDVTYDDYLEAFLESRGSSLYEFNMLLDHAVESGDEDLQDELLAIEEAVNVIIEADVTPIGNPLKKAAANLSARAAKGFQAGYAATQQAKPNAATQAADLGKKMGMPPAGDPASPKGAAGATGPVGKGGIPPVAGAAPPPMAAKPAAAGTAGGNTDQTAPTATSQPGQTEKEPKEPGLPKSGLGKIAQGVANIGVSAPAQAGNSLLGKVKRAGGKVKAGFQGEDIDYWEEFLGENGLTVDQYMSLVEDAYEYGDEEMIESSHQLDEIFAAWKAKKAAAQQDKQAKVKAGWEAARGVIAKHGAETVRAASVKGVDVPKKRAIGGGTSTNEAIEKQLQLMGYTDEYIEARTKSQQYHGMIAQAADTDVRGAVATGKMSQRAANDRRGRDNDFHKKFAKDLADKSSRQDKGKSNSYSWNKKLRSLSHDHNPAYGDKVADDRAFLKKKNKDPLAAKAAKSPRERRSDIRKAARGHRGDEG